MGIMDVNLIVPPKCFGMNGADCYYNVITTR